MKYTEFTAEIEKSKKDLQKFFKKVAQAPKNKTLDMYQDYYDGNQWENVHNSLGKTKVTRSGREMWKKDDQKNPATGFTAGQLKVWNLIKPAISIYSTYLRGNNADSIKIQVLKDGKADDELSGETLKIFTDLDKWVQRATISMCINSVIITKYNAFDAKKDNKDVEIARKIKGGDALAYVEIVDPRDAIPLYWHDMIRGYIRAYEVGEGKEKEIYADVWYIDDNAEVILEKYIDGVLQEDAPSPYDFLPFHLEANKKHEIFDFSTDSLEVGEVEDLVGLQDDLNAFLTDLGIIYRQVAIPMLKLTDEFAKSLKDRDIDKMKDALQKMNTYAGSLLSLPVEKLPATGVADSQVKYLQDLLDQYFRQTGIPRSVFNSEGLGQMSTKSLEHLFESLNKRVSEKRDILASTIRENVKMHLVHNNQWDETMTIEVIYPDIFTTEKTTQVDIIERAYRAELLPKEYAAGKIVEILGDTEHKEEIIADIVHHDLALKQEIESALARMDTERLNKQDSQELVREVEENNRDIVS